MKKSFKYALRATAVFLVALSVFAVQQRWFSLRHAGVAEQLRVLMECAPAETRGILYVDVAQLRQSPFAQKVFAWAPKPQADAEYTRFMQGTGFNYERDLDRVAFATWDRGAESKWVAILDGRFDAKKIAAYFTKIAAVQKRDGRDIYLIPTSLPPMSNELGSTLGSTLRFSLTFLEPGRIAATNYADLPALLAKRNPGAARSEWQSRFTRLAGSPVFVVVRQDLDAVDSLAAHAPGGLQSPQLSALLGQLSWLTLAGQPQPDALRVVAEGETSSDLVARQLADMLNGVIILAQAGLNDAQSRQQINPEARAAYLELLKTAEVAQMDRQETKAVRVVFEITPSFLNAASLPKPIPPTSAQAVEQTAPTRHKSSSHK